MMLLIVFDKEMLYKNIIFFLLVIFVFFVKAFAILVALYIRKLTQCLSILTTVLILTLCFKFKIYY